MLSANQIAGVLKQLFYPEQNDEIACFFCRLAQIHENLNVIHKFMR